MNAGEVPLARFICPFCCHPCIVTGSVQGIEIAHNKADCEVFAASTDREYIALVNRMRDLAQRRKVARA